MRANINNITYIQDQGRYYIVTEYSRLPVEVMGSKQDAIDFINGYLYGHNKNTYNRKGKMLRTFVEMDLIEGIPYMKVHELGIKSA